MAGDGTAVLEMSAASGLWRCAPEERDPWAASTFGTGQLVRHAVKDSGANSVLIGIGGSATNDGGTGFARALGVRFFDGSGKELTALPQQIGDIVRIDGSDAIEVPELVVACDVTNPLLGKNGATHIFGPQKGVSDLGAHEARLAHLADVVESWFRKPLRDLPGAGAAGGLGFGLMAFAGGQLKPGFDLVADALGLEEKIGAADLVLTGEGSLDAQTASGKGPAGVGLMAKRAGVPVWAFAGRVADREVVEPFFDAATEIRPPGWSVEQSMDAGSTLLEKAVSGAEALV
jgi:glycerate kinase